MKNSTPLDHGSATTVYLMSNASTRVNTTNSLSRFINELPAKFCEASAYKKWSLGIMGVYFDANFTFLRDNYKENSPYPDMFFNFDEKYPNHEDIQNPFPHLTIRPRTDINTRYITDHFAAEQDIFTDIDNSNLTCPDGGVPSAIPLPRTNDESSPCSTPPPCPPLPPPASPPPPHECPPTGLTALEKQTVRNLVAKLKDELRDVPRSDNEDLLNSLNAHVNAYISECKKNRDNLDSVEFALKQIDTIMYNISQETTLKNIRNKLLKEPELATVEGRKKLVANIKTLFKEYETDREARLTETGERGELIKGMQDKIRPYANERIYTQSTTLLPDLNRMIDSLISEFQANAVNFADLEGKIKDLQITIIEELNSDNVANGDIEELSILVNKLVVEYRRASSPKPEPLFSEATLNALFIQLEQERISVNLPGIKFNNGNVDALVMELINLYKSNISTCATLKTSIFEVLELYSDMASTDLAVAKQPLNSENLLGSVTTLLKQFYDVIDAFHNRELDQILKDTTAKNKLKELYNYAQNEDLDLDGKRLDALVNEIVPPIKTTLKELKNTRDTAAENQIDLLSNHIASLDIEINKMCRKHVEKLNDMIRDQNRSISRFEMQFKRAQEYLSELHTSQFNVANYKFMYETEPLPPPIDERRNAVHSYYPHYEYRDIERQPPYVDVIDSENFITSFLRATKAFEPAIKLEFITNTQFYTVRIHTAPHIHLYLRALPERFRRFIRGEYATSKAEPAKVNLTINKGGGATEKIPYLKFGTDGSDQTLLIVNIYLSTTLSDEVRAYFIKLRDNTRDLPVLFLNTDSQPGVRRPFRFQLLSINTLIKHNLIMYSKNAQDREKKLRDVIYYNDYIQIQNSSDDWFEVRGSTDLSIYVLNNSMHINFSGPHVNIYNLTTLTLELRPLQPFDGPLKKYTFYEVPLSYGSGVMLNFLGGATPDMPYLFFNASGFGNNYGSKEFVDWPVRTADPEMPDPSLFSRIPSLDITEEKEKCYTECVKFAQNEYPIEELRRKRSLSNDWYTIEDSDSKKRTRRSVPQNLQNRVIDVDPDKIDSLDKLFTVIQSGQFYTENLARVSFHTTHIRIDAAQNTRLYVKEGLFEQLSIIPLRVAVRRTSNIAKDVTYVELLFKIGSALFLAVKPNAPKSVHVGVSELDSFPSGGTYTQDLEQFAFLPSVRRATKTPNNNNFGRCQFEPSNIIPVPLGINFDRLSITLKDENGHALQLQEGQPTIIKTVLREANMFGQRVRLVSGQSMNYYPKNQPSEFTNVLAQPLVFPEYDQWEVAASSITFSRSLLGPDNEYCTFNISSGYYFPRPNHTGFASRYTADGNPATVSVKVRIGLLAYEPKLLVESPMGGSGIHIHRVDSNGTSDVKGKYLKFFVVDNFYSDSMNEFLRIRIDVGSAIALGFNLDDEEVDVQLEGYYTFTLGHFTGPQGHTEILTTYPFNLTALIPSSPILYSDIVEQSIVGSEYKDILTVIPISNDLIKRNTDENYLTTIPLEHPQFTTLNRTFISTITISLRKLDGSKAILYDPTKAGVTIDLWFRPKLIKNKYIA